jgi:hypothetical protein
MISWKPEGGKKRGRPRRTWKDGIYMFVYMYTVCVCMYVCIYCVYIHVYTIYIHTRIDMSERGLRMGKWNNRSQWSVEVGRRHQTF